MFDTFHLFSIPLMLAIYLHSLVVFYVFTVCIRCLAFNIVDVDVSVPTATYLSYDICFPAFKLKLIKTHLSLCPSVRPLVEQSNDDYKIARFVCLMRFFRADYNPHAIFYWAILLPFFPIRIGLCVCWLFFCCFISFHLFPYANFFEHITIVSQLDSLIRSVKN